MVDTPGATNEQIFWIITTAYLGRAGGVLGKATEYKLDALFLDKAQNWTEQVERAADTAIAENEIVENSAVPRYIAD